MTFSLILTNVVFPLLVNWLILFVSCYIVVEYAQNYFYDESTPLVGLKVLGGTFVFAGVNVWFKTSFDTMFTSNISLTVIQGVLWFAVFAFVFRFQPWHAFAIGVAAMLLLPGLATLGRDSILHSAAQGTPPVKPPSVPVRKSISGTRTIEPAKKAP